MLTKSQAARLLIAMENYGHATGLLATTVITKPQDIERNNEAKLNAECMYRAFQDILDEYTAPVTNQAPVVS